MPKKIRVKPYTRKDGTKVKGHMRQIFPKRKEGSYVVDSRTKELYDEFGLSPIEANELNQLLSNSESFGSYYNVDITLEKANKMIGGYGVEALTDEREWINDYYQNIVGLYVNKGDTYDTTIIYDTAKDKFIVGNWGDFIENYDKNH